MEFAGGGAACIQPTCGLSVVAQAVHKKEQKIYECREVETNKTKERGTREEVADLEICGSAESVKKTIVWLRVVNIGLRLWPRASLS